MFDVASCIDFDHIALLKLRAFRGVHLGLAARFDPSKLSAIRI